MGWWGPDWPHRRFYLQQHEVWIRCVISVKCYTCADVTAVETWQLEKKEKKNLIFFFFLNKEAAPLQTESVEEAVVHGERFLFVLICFCHTLSDHSLFLKAGFSNSGPQPTPAHSHMSMFIFYLKNQRRSGPQTDDLWTLGATDSSDLFGMVNIRNQNHFRDSISFWQPLKFHQVNWKQH